MEALTGRPPSIALTEFTGGSLAVTAQVLLVISPFGLGELITPHMPVETATQKAIQAMVNPEVPRLGHVYIPSPIRVATYPVLGKY